MPSPRLTVTAERRKTTCRADELNPKDPFLVHNIEVDEEDNLAVMLDQDLPSGFACRPGYLAVLYLGSAAIDWIPVSESVTPVEVEVHYTRP